MKKISRWIAWLWRAPFTVNERIEACTITITDERLKLLELKQRVEDLEKQIADLRAIVTHQEKSKPAEVRVARRMSEVRTFLQQGDEDAA